jgi:predicted Zn-dependent protease
VADLEKKYKPLDDRVVSDYVNALGKRLSAAGTAAPLTIRLVSAEEPLAAVFPGAYLVLSSGVIRRAGNESER